MAGFVLNNSFISGRDVGNFLVTLSIVLLPSGYFATLHQLQFGLETYFLAQSAVLAFVPDADEVTDHGSEYFARTRVTHHVLRGGTIYTE
jgi:hypothetical protein